ncbi:hypothetical protein [Cryptosporangium phraense]|uniref:Uncharacterized protein n=1 Tax=Cryptosporangium phraense TaxID=2593070 RepID=A0A545AVT0_9ACTN|nr:hypothetical protein [Cryptosporangium phraense]TQS45436.1 hypothetical protein FL583_10180 [Cryptosporangium phraense]
MSTEDELRGYVRSLMEARTNVRAVAAETGLSKTTVNELRMGRRRVSLDALTKVVGAYAPAEVADARQAWHRVQPPRPRRAPTAPAETAPTGSGPEAAAPDLGLRREEAPGASGGGSPGGVEKRNRWLPVGLWPRVVYAAIAVLAAVAVADGVRAVADREPDPATAAAAPCITPAQETTAQLTKPTGTTPVTLTEVAYHLQRVDPPRLEIAAALSGAVPDGSTVQILERADPATVDSTPEHHPGNGRYYPRPSIRSVGGCVYVPQNQIGYAGFAGMRLRYTVVLLPARFADSIVADSHAGDGLSEQDLARYSMTRLGWFEFRV